MRRSRSGARAPSTRGARPSRGAPTTWARSTPRRSSACARRPVRGRTEVLGPVTARALADSLGLPDTALIDGTLLALENEGKLLRGRFTGGAAQLEWCDRRLLARIHRYTLNRLRAEIEPV